MRGIDLSHWNGNIDFSKVKDNVDFIILKCGGSDSTKGCYQDKKFEEYYNECKKYNIPVGCYFYCGKNSNTIDSAMFDSTRMYEIIKGKQFEMPIYLDYEVGSRALREKNTLYAKTFCQELENRGYFVGIYASDISGFKELLNRDKLTEFTWWVARYSKNKPSYAVKNMGIWQYSSTGKVNGINGNVDMDECYINFPDIIKKKGLNGYGNRPFV